MAVVNYNMQEYTAACEIALACCTTFFFEWEPFKHADNSCKKFSAGKKKA